MTNKMKTHSEQELLAIIEKQRQLILEYEELMYNATCHDKMDELIEYVINKVKMI